MEKKDLQELMSILSYDFKNPQLLETALTHSTYAYENRGIENNERLEFLGDAVLQLIISERLFFMPGKPQEGEMTKARSLVVCERTLARAASDISLAKYLQLGKGELMTGGSTKPSNLANTLEAVFGAVYLDGGLSSARKVIVALLASYLELAMSGEIQYDFKSRLLELVQTAKGHSTLNFVIIAEEGPVHDRTFTAAVIIDDIEVTSGRGSSKKEAEQNAARKALTMIVCDDSGCGLLSDLTESIQDGVGD
ncbi:MAG: ribonuclease III [Saccharofermentanales bacterium]|jgi:ribonuclease-3